MPQQPPASPWRRQQTDGAPGDTAVRDGVERPWSCGWYVRPDHSRMVNRMTPTRTPDPPGAVTSLAELTVAVRRFAEDRDWQQFHTPKNLAMALAGEVGELLAELQWLTPAESTVVMDDPAAGARVRAEVGDVTIYLVRLADVLGIDLVQAASAKLADSASRYSVDRARGTAAKAS